MHEYFLGDPTLSENLGGKGILTMNAFKRNRYLAEDRIIPFEVVSKSGYKWHTTIINRAIAYTDVPEDIVDFITQRRRWLNGALASTVYQIIHFGRLYSSGHNIFRKLLFTLQLLYNTISLVMTWFNLATFLIILFLVNDLAGNPPDVAGGPELRPFPFGKSTPIINVLVQMVYSMTVVMQFILAMGSKLRSQITSYIVSFAIFGVVQVYMLVNMVYLIHRLIKCKGYSIDGNNYDYISTFYTDVGDLTVLVTCATVFGTYIASAIIYLDAWHMFISYPQYLFVQSSYTNILNIYAFSNWHDVSWGTKKGKAEEFIGMLRSETIKVDPISDMCVVEEVDLPARDIDDLFIATVKRALTPFVPKKNEKHVPSLEDSFTAFRTKLVACYIFSNIMLCIFVLNDNFDSLKFLV